MLASLPETLVQLSCPTGLGQSFRQTVQEQMDISIEKKSCVPYLTLYTEINLKWITDLHLRAKTINFFEENNVGILFELD